jgi:hypothetical protein
MAGLFILALALNCATPDAPVARLRSDEPGTRALIADGLTRSQTFRALAATLDDTDVVVYVTTAIIRSGLGGYLPHSIVTADSRRYVRLVVSAEGADNRRIGIIAHELQHAIEIARVPEVGRSQSVSDLFARIGYRRGHARDAYETMDAVEIERVVREELVRGRSRPPSLHLCAMSAP